MIVPQPPGAPVVLCGATGALGRRIAVHLKARGASVRALVRPGSNTSIPELEGVQLIHVDFNDTGQLAQACAGGSCLLSALSGLRDVMVDLQARLLEAALEARITRFIPSDYCIDYTTLPPGRNRNLDLRREFSWRLDRAPIRGTSVLNGMFADLLTGQAPLVLRKQKRILYWGSADQLLDFTSLEDTAAYTAAAALDPLAPRYLRIAGDVCSIRGLQAAAERASGVPFRLLRAGSLAVLRALIGTTRLLMPAKKEVFPPWQGMQYLHDMLSGKAKLEPLDNDRYTDLHWTSVEKVLRKGWKRSTRK